MTLVDISEIGRSAKSYCEHTARTPPTLSDIVVTLVEMGERISSISCFLISELGPLGREESLVVGVSAECSWIPSWFP